MTIRSEYSLVYTEVRGQEFQTYCLQREKWRFPNACNNVETSTEKALNYSGESPRKSVRKYRKIKQTKSIVSIKSMKSKNYTFKEILILYIYRYSSVVHKRMTVVSRESTWANKLSCELNLATLLMKHHFLLYFMLHH